MKYPQVGLATGFEGNGPAPDATARETTDTASPDGGPMGVWQPAAAGPAGYRSPAMAALTSFFQRLFCRHRRGYLVAIEWDGTAVYECKACSKHVRIPLGKGS